MIELSLERTKTPRALENRKEVMDAIKKDSLYAVNEAAFLVKNKLMSVSPTVSGALNKSWGIDIQSLAGQVRARVYSGHPAAHIFQYGARPGSEDDLAARSHFPPPGRLAVGGKSFTERPALESWIRAIGGWNGFDIDTPRDLHRLAFIISRARKEKGVAAEFKWTRAIESIQGRITAIFNRARDKMKSRLEGNF